MEYSQRENEAKNADDVLFDMFRNDSTDLLPIGKFLAVSYCSFSLNFNFIVNSLKKSEIFMFSGTSNIRNTNEWLTDQRDDG